MPPYCATRAWLDNSGKSYINPYNTMEQNTNTREAAMYEQIAKLQGRSTESIHILYTNAGEVKLTVSAVTDYDDLNHLGGSSYERPYVYQVRLDASLPEPVSTKFNSRRFTTAVEAYEWAVKVVRAYADKVSELSQLLDA